MPVPRREYAGRAPLRWQALERRQNAGVRARKTISHRNATRSALRSEGDLTSAIRWAGTGAPGRRVARWSTPAPRWPVPRMGLARCTGPQGGCPGQAPRLAAFPAIEPLREQTGTRGVGSLLSKETGGRRCHERPSVLALGGSFMPDLAFLPQRW